MNNRMALCLGLFAVLCLIARCDAPVAAVPSLSLIREPTVLHQLDLSLITVPKDVPQTYYLSHSLYGRNVKVKMSEDVPDEIAKRERAYTWRWLSPLIEVRYLPYQLEESIDLARGVNGKDDAVYLAYTMPVGIADDSGPRFRVYDEECRIQIIDTRDLSVLIKQKWIRDKSIQEIVGEYIRYHRYLVGTDMRVTDEKKLNSSCSYGKFQIEYPSNPSIAPIRFEWYRDGDTILFVWNKMRDPVVGKVMPDPATFIGGIPYSDPRPYLRFEKSNRVELSKEYWKKREPAWKARQPKYDPADAYRIK